MIRQARPIEIELPTGKLGIIWNALSFVMELILIWLPMNIVFFFKNTDTIFRSLSGLS